MAIVYGMPTYFPRRLSEYVPAMAYSADVNYNGLTRISFGAPALLSATALIAAQSIATAGSTQTTLLTANTIDAPWGRTLQVIASGAATSNVTITGWDYMGQPMTESFTLNGTTAVIGNKAFKYINTITWALTAATTINVGTGSRLGLPYKTIKVDHETADQVLAAAGTLLAPSLVDPQTATTTDPRGLYTCTTTLDGVKVITISCHCMNDVNAAGNGGLHGLPHFAS